MVLDSVAGTRGVAQMCGVSGAHDRCSNRGWSGWAMGSARKHQHIGLVSQLGLALHVRRLKKS